MGLVLDRARLGCLTPMGRSRTSIGLSRPAAESLKPAPSLPATRFASRNDYIRDLRNGSLGRVVENSGDLCRVAFDEATRQRYRRRTLWSPTL